MKFEVSDQVKIGKHGKVMEVDKVYPIGQFATLVTPEGERLIAVPFSEIEMVSQYRSVDASKIVASSLSAYFPLAA